MAEASRDQNRITTLLGASNSDGLTPVTVYVDSTTHRLLVNTTVTGTISSDNLGTAVKYGRATSSGSATALGSSQTLKNGLIVQALSTNTVSVFIGDASVTTSTGFELQAGQATSIALDDPSSAYVIADSSASVCWISSA